MKSLVEGHRYELSNFEDNSKGQQVQFIHKEQNNGSLQTLVDGTTNEEVIEMLINRMEFLQEKMPCRENERAIVKLIECLMWLNRRTSNRIARGVEGTHKK